MRKRRPENQGLPKRWRHRHGAYYYAVPAGLEHLWDDKREFRLGASLPEAYREWAARLNDASDLRTVGDLLDRYAREVVPTKAPKTQASNEYAIKRLRAVFGRMTLGSPRPRHVYQYLDRRQAKTAGLREVEVLSHAYTKAIEWGAIDRHPFLGQMRKTKPKARTRYVDDWEIAEALKIAPPMLHAYLRMKLLTGLRRGDLLRLRPQDNRKDGLHVDTHKTGRRLVIGWTPDLQQAFDDALAARPKHIAPWLFCNRSGECYVKENGSANGWDSLWQRFMKKLLTETKVTERFTEHDLRAKCASDADTLEHAQALLAHADSATTKRIYRRKPEYVLPIQSDNAAFIGQRPDQTNRESGASD